MIINTIVLALEHHGIEDDFSDILKLLNLIFTIIFAVEMTLKLIAFGFRGYFSDSMNYLDGAVVVMSIFEIAFLSDGSAISAFRALRVFRIFRVIRVARLFRYLDSLA